MSKNVTIEHFEKKASGEVVDRRLPQKNLTSISAAVSEKPQLRAGPKTDF